MKEVKMLKNQENVINSDKKHVAERCRMHYYLRDDKTFNEFELSSGT
jgi:hypothetical protein